MTFTVEKILGEPREWESPHGTMLTYKLVGSLDGAATETVSINTKKDQPKVPKVGEDIDCEIAKDHPTFGKTIKRATPAPTAQFNPTARANTAPFKDNSPSIERQVALKCAVELAGYYVAGKQSFGIDEVLDFAERFDRFLKHETPRSATEVMYDPMPNYTGEGEEV